MHHSETLYDQETLSITTGYNVFVFNHNTHDYALHSTYTLEKDAIECGKNITSDCDVLIMRYKEVTTRTTYNTGTITILN